MRERGKSAVDVRELLRRLPAVDEVLQHPDVAALAARVDRALLAAFAREAIEGVRRALLDSARPSVELAAEIELERIAQAVLLRVARDEQAGLVRAVNATGVVLHTGLGRAPVHPEAARAMGEAAGFYCTLEIDRESGERNERDARAGTLAARLLGAEAAIAVNNNAAAVVLALSGLARDKEVVLSRGELVEIGGSFRMPDVMASAGVILREVGTTNRTRLADYRAAIGPSTGMLLKVHTSNYRLEGFTEEVGVRELALLAREFELPCVYDLGSGLIDAAGAEPLALLADEPRAAAAVQSGAAVVTFSGDKLLGAPQAGILAGRRDAIARLRKSPLYRAMRLDKVTLAGLEATLRLYAAGRGGEIPSRALMLVPLAELATRAERIARAIARIPGFSAEAIESTSQPGSGSAPGTFLPSRAVRVTRAGHSPAALARALRTGEPPVFARVQDDALLLDPRTLLAGDEERLLAAFARLSAT